MVLTVTAIVLLLAANAFLVAAEFAIVKIRGIRETLAAQGSAVARLTLRILADVPGLSLGRPARHHDGLARPRLDRRAGSRGDARAFATGARSARS